MGLIIKNIHFFFALRDSLFSEHGVSGWNDDGLSKQFRTYITDDFSNIHHCSIAYPSISYLFEFSTIRYLSILCKEVIFGNSDTSKVEIAILFGMETNFRSNVASFDSWKPIIVFVFDWNQERIYSIIFSIDDCLSKDHSMVGKEWYFSRPIFSTWGSGWVNDPLLSGPIVDGSSFKTSDIWAMADLSLSIAASNLAASGLIKIQFFMLLCAHKLNVLNKHAKVS